jgi:Flp pilus assembly protein TadD
MSCCCFCCCCCGQACLQLLARGSSLNPADPALYQARGVVEKEAGRHDAARAMFRQGLQVDKRHLYLWQVSTEH